VDENFETNTQMAARNIDRVHMVSAASLNAWDIVRFKNVLISEQGFAKILARAND
jgi:large subunit ribosomal protein L4